MAQIINFIITLAEMLGLRGVSSYSRATSAYNAGGIVLFAVSIFLNVYFVRDVYETKKQIAHIKLQSNEVAILRNRLVEKEAAIQALVDALSMFIPEEAAAKFREKQLKRQQEIDGHPSAKPTPVEPAKPEQKLPAKPTALPPRDPVIDPDKKYL